MSIRCIYIYVYVRKLTWMSHLGFRKKRRKIRDEHWQKGED